MENIEKGKTPEWYLILALIWGVMGGYRIYIIENSAS